MEKTSPNLYTFIWTSLKIYRWNIYGICLSVFIASLITVVDPYLLKILIDKITLDKNNFDFFSDKEYIIIIVVFVILNIFSNFIWRFINYLALKTFPEARLLASSEAYSYLVAHSNQYFQDNMAGDLANKIQNISEGIENIFMPTISVFYILFTVLVSIVIAYTINIYFSIALIIWVILFITISLNLSNNVIKQSKEFSQLKSVLNGKYVDSLANMFNIKIFARQNYEKLYLEKTSYEVMKKDIDFRWKLLKLWAAQGVLCSLILGVVIAILVFLRLNAIVTTGDFVFIVSITITIVHQVFGIAVLVSKILERIGIIDQAISVVYIPHTIVNAKKAKCLEIKKADVVFKNLEFSYTKEKALFKNINIHIPAYKIIGLVGHSGSGKTTFINLLLRLFDVQKGEILIDKQNIAKVTQKSLHENISFIPQNPILFHRTFMENIRYGRLEATDAEVIEAAKKAHAHEFILGTYKGYESLVGENGIKISGGERQRIAIARAILKNAPILILDEATSSLDSITEALIQKSLQTLMKNKTVLIIAHRLSTLVMSDRILVLDQGKIVEDGSHKDLIIQNNLYTKLWNSQIGGFLVDSI